MAKTEFVEIIACANAIEAEQVRGVLEVQGVSAFLNGANTNTMLSHVGTALGGVRVLVRASDAEKARQIVDSAMAPAASGPWYCGQCQETIDATFDLCWSCGNERSEVERPFPPAQNEVVRETEEASDVPDAPLPDTSGYDHSNPYASPRAPGEPDAPSEAEGEISEEAEAMLLRAWRASIIGLVFLPFILQMYSMYLLIRAATITNVFSPTGQKLFYRAFAVNVVAGCFWGLIFSTMFR